MPVAERQAVAISHGITLIGMPPLFWVYTRIHNDGGQLLLLVLLAVLTLASLQLARTLPADRAARAQAGVHARLWIAAAVLYGAALAWNRLYRGQVLAHDYHGDVFRSIYWNFWAPLYGQREAVDARELLLVLALGAVLYAALRLYERYAARCGPALPLLGLAGLNLVLIAAYALTQDSARLLGNVYDYHNFGTAADLARFNSLHEVWANWTRLMPVLHGRNPHYPPGNLFLLKLEQVYGLHGLFKAGVIAATLGCVPLLYALGRRLDLSRQAALTAVALFVTTASTGIFPSTSTAPVTMFFTLLCYLGLFHALHTGTLRGAVLAGLALAVYALFSFSVSIVGLSVLLISLAALFHGGVDARAVIRTNLVLGLTLVLCLLLLYLASDFNIWGCLQQAIRQNSAIMTASPFDTPARYLLRSSGNLIAYLLFTGIVPAALAASGVLCLARAPHAARGFLLGGAVTLIAAACSGLFFMETERIWVFFTPWLALAAAWGLYAGSDGGQRRTLTGVLLLTALLSTGVQEICFRHYWD